MSNSNIDFFIIGYPRSGTTLAASLLSRNPEIYISPETHFYRNFVKNNKDIKSKESLIDAFLTDKRLADLNIERKDLTDFSPETHTLNWLLNKALSIKAAENEKSIIGEKTPAHMLYINKIIHDYPESRFIVIIRDGRDCVLSNIKEKWTFSNPVKHAAEWNMYMRHYKKLLAKHRNKVYTIRYEDLIDSPSKYVEILTEFVGGKYTPEQIESDTTKSVIPEWEKEWKEKASKAPDKNNKYKWKSYGNKDLINTLTFIMSKDLSDFGYDISSNAQLKQTERLGITLRNFVYMPRIYPFFKLLASTPVYKPYKYLLNKINS